MPALLPREAALLEGWEFGAPVPRPALRYHELFERVIDQSTDQGARPAVITQTGSTTYAALEREANSIAHDLLRRGVAAGSVIGVLTGRSANLPAAVLGIWKAGATYLPQPGMSGCDYVTVGSFIKVLLRQSCVTAFRAPR